METRFPSIAKSSARALAAVLTFSLLAGNALAVSTWNPTLLVNTESFEVIDEGNGTSNVYIQFGQTLNKTITYNRTNSRFEFNDSVSVRGTLSGSTLSIDGTANIRGATTITGDTKVRGNLSGSTLNVDGTATVNGATTITGNTSITGAATITGNTKVRGNLSGSTLNVDGTAIVNGTLSATGAITTKSNLTINGDNDTNDATLTFGNQTSAQTVKFSHTNQRFEFSKDVKVTGNIRASGNLSGSTLTVDGNLTLKGVTYSAPTSQGSANTYLKNDGAGNLTWSTTSTANGSGGSLSLHPEYPNAVYTASGSSANVGTLTYSYDSTNKENFYRWTSSQGTMQDYWIAVRVKVPKNFNNWTPTPIQFRYRTSSTSTAANYLTIKLLDTTGALVATSGGAALASGSSNTWATATLTNVSSGTYTPDGFITILVKLASTSTGYSDAGYINVNWSTTTP